MLLNVTRRRNASSLVSHHHTNPSAKSLRLLKTADRSFPSLTVFASRVGPPRPSRRCSNVCVCVLHPQLSLPVVNRLPAALEPPASASAQPPLMGNVDPSKVDEIRRTVYVGNLNSQVTCCRNHSPSIYIVPEPWSCLARRARCQFAGIQRIY